MTISDMRDKIKNFTWDLDEFWNDNRGKNADLCDNVERALDRLDSALSAEERATDPDRKRE